MMEDNLNVCLIFTSIVDSTQMQAFHHSIIHGFLFPHCRELARWRRLAREHTRSFRVHVHASNDGIVGGGYVRAPEHLWVDL